MFAIKVLSILQIKSKMTTNITLIMMDYHIHIGIISMAVSILNLKDCQSKTRKSM